MNETKEPLISSLWLLAAATAVVALVISIFIGLVRVNMNSSHRWYPCEYPCVSNTDSPRRN